MSPIIFNKLPYWNRWNSPMDFGKTFKGKRIFGDNKKWRGLVSGIAIATLTVWLQHLLATSNSVPVSLVVSKISGEINYFDAGILWLGPALGFGAIAGDAIESFFKRRIGKKPGESWFPFDQIDYIVGGLLISTLVVDLNHWWQVASIFIVYFGLHLISTNIGYLLKLKDKPI